MNTVDAGITNHSVRVLSGAFVVAVAINLALLLLIGALISRRETQQVSAPNPQPIDFIRIAPRAEEPKPVPKAAPKTIVDAASEPRPESERPASTPKKPSAKTSPGPSRRPGAPKKLGKAKAAAPGVPAPRIDIPEQGTGAPFAAVPGSDSRLTAPPAQWNMEKTPGTSGGDQDSAVGSGGGGGGSGGWNLVALSRVKPRYPPRARNEGIEGWVLLEITVSPTGAVSDARVLDAKPKRIFDQAALEAIRQWRFRPRFREGRAVEQRANQEIRFRLKRR